jgi:arsenate reductase (thioredoxin)
MKVKVGFICVHNSCRSQMAEAIAKLKAEDTIEAYSGGTALKDEINPDAVRVVQQLYGVDMRATQSSKLITELPELDIVVKMGCNVVCPFLPSKYEEDWGLQDPSGKGDEEFVKTARSIEDKLENLVSRIKAGTIEL